MNRRTPAEPTIPRKKLPLLYHTPARWAKKVLEDPLALLSDHAYLEKKATSNALELFNRWPDPYYPPLWVPTLSSIVKDEAMHLQMVTQLLQKRGGKIQRSHRNPYATELHQIVRRGHGPKDIADRLLVSALIEARSCERFNLLAKNSQDQELSNFYRGLWTSEFGHFTLFYKLAEEVLSHEDVKNRWKEFLDEEAKIMARQPAGPRMHSGVC